jgi:hypothetical protein
MKLTSSESSLATWRPLLDREQARRATRIAMEIADAALAPETIDLHAGLAGLTLTGGRAGVALLFDQLHRTFPDRGYDATARQLVEDAVGRLGEQPTELSLYVGLTGVAWVIEHLRGSSLPAVDDGELDDVDAMIAEALVDWNGDFELLAGLVGLGVYTLARLPRPTARHNLEVIIDRLGAAATPTALGLTWRQTAAHRTKTFPDGNDNFGMAHGTPGVAAFLGLACAAGFAAAAPLRDGAVAHLATWTAPLGTLPGAQDAAGRRAAGHFGWCYGEGGRAVGLMIAGSADARRLGETLARIAAAHRPEVVDAGLCHGAAGLGHIFNRLAHATNDPTCAEAARGWFERVSALRGPGGVAGFTVNERARLVPSAGFLSGASGVALALLAASSDVAPSWDRLLLLS